MGKKVFLPLVLLVLGWPLLDGAPLLLRIVLVLAMLWVPLWVLLWRVLLQVRPLVPLVMFQQMGRNRARPAWPARVTLLPHFAFDNRALDAWVLAHLPAARTNFERLGTVARRATHLPLPHTLAGKPVHHVATYEEILGRDHFCLLISGEGGAGKTSLACWLAHHCMGRGPGAEPLTSPLWEEVRKPLAGFPMLPLLMESGVAGKDMGEVLGRQLQELTGCVTPPPAYFVRLLLARRRVLLIVDHLSERDERTRETLAQLPEDFHINAMVVTSRKNGELPGYEPVLVVPTGISGSALMGFVERLLPLSKPHSGEDEVDETYTLIKQLSGGFAVTPLLIRLVLDEVAAMQREQAAHPSHNLPELVEGYLVRLCEQAGDREKLVPLARFAAWACIKDRFRPCKGYGHILRAWAPNCTPDQLARLVNVGMLQWVDEAEQCFRFAVDPVAEYLAASLLVRSDPETDPVWLAMKQRVLANLTAEEEAQGVGFSRERAWTFLLAELDTAVQDDREALVGFLKALQHTVVAIGHAHQVPEQVGIALQGRTRLAGQESKAGKRSAGLLGRLHHEDPEERAYAATRLADLGVNKPKTAAALAERLQLEEDLEVERALVRALGRLGERRSLDALVETVNHGQAVVRMEAARALAQSELAAHGQRALIKMVDDEVPMVAQAVSSLLLKIPLEVDALVSCLVQSRREHRDGLRDWVLARIGQDLVDAYPALLPFLGDEDDEVAVAAALSFDRLVHVCSEPVGTRMVDALLGNLDRTPRVVTGSIRALESACVFGKNRNLARRSFGPLTGLLVSSEEAGVKQAATRALFTLYRQTEKPPALRELMNWVGDNELYRKGLLSFVMLAEKEARHMAADLKGLLEDKHMHVRYRAAMALAPFDQGADSLQILTEALQDKGFEDRVEVAGVLGELGEHASSSLWVLVALAGHGEHDENLRRAAQSAVSSIKRDMVTQGR